MKKKATVERNHRFKSVKEVQHSFFHFRRYKTYTVQLQVSDLIILPTVFLVLLLHVWHQCRALLHDNALENNIFLYMIPILKSWYVLNISYVSLVDWSAGVFTYSELSSTKKTWKKTNVNIRMIRINYSKTNLWIM